MKMINEREQMKNWIAISESQQIDEGLMQTIMAPFKWLGGALVMVWNIIKGAMRLLALIIEYSGKATMLVATPIKWISHLITIIFRALAGTGHFMNEFGREFRRFMESAGIDGDALLEEKSDVEQMIRDIHDAIKQLNAKTTPEMKAKFAELSDPENEESQTFIKNFAIQINKTMMKNPEQEPATTQQVPDTEPATPDVGT